MKYLKLFNESIIGEVTSESPNEVIFEVPVQQHFELVDSIEPDDITDIEFDKIKESMLLLSRYNPKYKIRVEFWSTDDIRLSITKIRKTINGWTSNNTNDEFSAINLSLENYMTIVFYKCKDEWWLCHIRRTRDTADNKLYLIDSFRYLIEFISNLDQYII